MDKKSFLMYLDYEEHFKLLTDEELGQLMRAIMEYEKNHIELELSGMAKMAFSFIKQQLDKNREKYNEKCEQNRENGRRGGRPRKEEKDENIDEGEEEKQPDNFETEKTERFFRNQRVIFKTEKTR